MSLIIGLGSKARIGKDYAAKVLGQHFDVERISFADRLKQDLNKLFYSQGLDFFELDKMPRLKEFYRPLMVAYGELRRAEDPDHWVKVAFDREFNHQVTIIADVRYPNEVKEVQKRGGVVIEVETINPPANETEALYSPQCARLADYTIKNNFNEQYDKDLIALVHKLLDQKEREGKYQTMVERTRREHGTGLITLENKPRFDEISYVREIADRIVEERIEKSHS